MPKKLPKYLKTEELQKLLNAPPRERMRDRLILRLLAHCGLRVSELCNLDILDIDFNEEILMVRGGKGGKDRAVPIDVITLDLLDLYIGDIKGKVIKSNKGGSLSQRQIQTLVKNYTKKAGLRNDVTPHTLRHSFAVHSLNSGRSIRTVQKILGHSSLTTTQIYLDITSADVKDDCKRNPLPY